MLLDASEKETHMHKKLGMLLSIGLIISMGCQVEYATEHAALELTSAGFEQDVLNSNKVVLVDCWAPW